MSESAERAPADEAAPPGPLPRRILVVRVGAMGDVLHALPAVAALRSMLPEARIGWAIDTRWASLVEGGGVVDRIFPVPTRLWHQRPLSAATVRSLAGLYRDMQEEEFDLAIDLQGTLRSGVIAGVSGAERRVGLARPRERWARWFYSDEVETRAAHVVEQAAEIVSAAVRRQVAPARDVWLPRDAAAEAWTERVLGGAQGGPVALLAPAAGWGAKQWPAERFGALARLLAGQGATVLVNATRVGDAVATEVVRASGGVAREAVSTLPELVALLRRVDVFVGGDSGPMHLAAALGRPLVALFGPTDPARNGPWEAEPTGRFRVLRDPGSVTDHTRRAGPEQGLARIAVAEVFGEAMGLLERRDGR